MLTVPVLNGKGRGTTGQQSFVTVLNGGLDILRITIHAADNDHVFEPTCDKQFAIPIAEPEVTGSQIGSLIVGVTRPCEKRFLCDFGTIPITDSDAGAVYPDFADLVGFQRLESFRMDDQNMFIRQHASTANKILTLLVISVDMCDTVFGQIIHMKSANRCGL